MRLAGSGQRHTSHRSSSELSPHPSSPLQRIALDLHRPFRHWKAHRGHSNSPSNWLKEERVCLIKGLPLLWRLLFTTVEGGTLLSFAIIRSMTRRSALTSCEFCISPDWTRIISSDLNRLEVVPKWDLADSFDAFIRLWLSSSTFFLAKYVGLSQISSRSSLPSAQSSTALQKTKLGKHWPFAHSNVPLGHFPEVCHAPKSEPAELLVEAVVEEQANSSLPSPHSRFPLHNLERDKHPLPSRHLKASAGQSGKFEPDGFKLDPMGLLGPLEAPRLASWEKQNSSSLPSSQFLNWSQTKYQEMQCPLRHWNVSLWQPVEFDEHLGLATMHSQIPFTQSLLISLAWQSSLDLHGLPSELARMSVVVMGAALLDASWISGALPAVLSWVLVADWGSSESWVWAACVTTSSYWCLESIEPEADNLTDWLPLLVTFSPPAAKLCRSISSWLAAWIRSHSSRLAELRKPWEQRQRLELMLEVCHLNSRLSCSSGSRHVASRVISWHSLSSRQASPSPMRHVFGGKWGNVSWVATWDR